LIELLTALNANRESHFPHLVVRGIGHG
jgi:hypothetical protein